jgi:hypothetical protein
MGNTPAPNIHQSLAVLFLYQTQEMCHNTLMDTLNTQLTKLQLVKDWYMLPYFAECVRSQ